MFGDKGLESLLSLSIGLNSVMFPADGPKKGGEKSFRREHFGSFEEMRRRRQTK
jgi:hypothetical protein